MQALSLVRVSFHKHYTFKLWDTFEPQLTLGVCWTRWFQHWISSSMLLLSWNLTLFVKTLRSCTSVLVQCCLQPGVRICSVSWGQVQTCSVWPRYPWLQGFWLLVVGTRMTHDLQAENGHNCFFLPVLPDLAHCSE